VFVIEKREGVDGLQRGADHGGPAHAGPPPHQQGHSAAPGTEEPLCLYCASTTSHQFTWNIACLQCVFT